jgi:DNA-binding transcriptional MerR regulator
MQSKKWGVVRSAVKTVVSEQRMGGVPLDKVEEVVEKVEDKVEEVVDKVEEKVEEVVEKLDALIDEKVPDALKEHARELVDNAKVEVARAVEKLTVEVAENLPSQCCGIRIPVALQTLLRNVLLSRSRRVETPNILKSSETPNVERRGSLSVRTVLQSSP